jgi:transposase
VTIVSQTRSEENIVDVAVGLDVAARTVDAVVRRAGVNGKATTFEQTAAGHARLIKLLKPLRPDCVVLEATGIYYLDLAIALDQAGLPVCVINPKSARRFAELKLINTKTDRVDAGLLAEYGQRLSPPRWHAPDATRLALRDLGRQINRLIGSRTQAKNRLHALQAKGGTLKLLIQDERAGIAQFNRRLERLEQAALALIADSPELCAQMQCMRAAKGVGQATAIALLAEFCLLPSHLKAPQVSRHAGLDVRLHQSGSSVNRPARLSKTGNRYLRAALFMPAMNAIQREPRAKAFYQALVARGKKKMQALCAVMRKYLTGLWVCYKQSVPFDPARLFAEVRLTRA